MSYTVFPSELTHTNPRRPDFVLSNAIKPPRLEPFQFPTKIGTLSSFAERWVRSAKDECLSKLILFGERSLRLALKHYVAHFYEERNHQGKGNLLLFPSVEQPNPAHGSVRCRERLGGLLKYYYRAGMSRPLLNLVG